jgi:hypothetical protein
MGGLHRSRVLARTSDFCLDVRCEQYRRRTLRFSRLTAPSFERSGNSEEVAGQGGSRRVPSFSGQTLTLLMPLVTGAIRRFVVEFDATFNSCSAKVGFAKEVGHPTAFKHSIISSNKLVEVASELDEGVICSVQSGNLFGGQ